MIYHISVYKDKKGDLLLIPNVKTDAGFSIEINKPVVLNAPYENNVIGEKVRECLEISRMEPVYSSKQVVKVFEIVTGIKSYSKFSKDRCTVTVFFDTEKGITILPLERLSDGSYRPNKEKYPEIILEFSSTNDELGWAIINELNKLKN